MPLVGATIIPTAPLLVPGVSARLPDGVAEVRAAVKAALERLERAEIAVLIAAGEGATGATGAAGAARGQGSTGEGGADEHAGASLAGFGYPGIAARVRVVGWLTETRRYDPLPPGLAVLALLLGDHAPVAPINVNAHATAERLATLGAAIAARPRERAILLAAGDLSAGLHERSPRYRVEGAVAWDEMMVAAIEAQRPERLAALGPAEARRVAALGWAPIVVAQAACMAAGLRLRTRHYSAPRGVGYLIAATGG